MAREEDTHAKPTLRYKNYKTQHEAIGCCWCSLSKRRYSVFRVRPKRKFYADKRGILYTEIMLPENAPPDYYDRNALWNAAEKIENQWNSQLARRFVLALPVEVPAEHYPDMVREYCKEHFVFKGMCCDIAIHDIGKGNPHCHVMLNRPTLAI